MVINFNFRHGAKKSGHTLQIYNYKRVKEWREVTFMKEWVKPLYIGYLQALDLQEQVKLKLQSFPHLHAMLNSRVEIYHLFVCLFVIYNKQI